jgi:DNA-binding NtrC family response regulator
MDTNGIGVEGYQDFGFCIKAKGESRGLVVWVDDQLEAIWAYSQFLSNHGFEVIAFNSPSAFLEWIERPENRDKVSVALIDLWSPPGSDSKNILHESLLNFDQRAIGTAVIKYLRDKGFAISICVVSALSTELKANLDRSDVEFLDKPVNPQKLLSVVESAIKVS